MDDFDYIFKVGSSGTGNTNLANPTDVCIDTDLLRLAITDGGNNRILLWDLFGGTYIDKKTDYGSAFTDFSSPDGICYYNGFFYVCDTDNHVLVRLRARDLKYKDHFGTIGTSGSTTSTLHNPNSVCHNKTHLFISDLGNSRIMKLDLETLEYDSQESTFDPGGYTLSSPNGVAYQDQEKAIYVTDRGNNRIMKLSTGLKYVDKVGSSGSDNGEFSAPRHIVVVGDILYVCDRGNHRIQAFDTATLTYRAKQGSQGTGNEQLDAPYGLCAYRNMIIIAEQGSNDRLMFWYNYDPRRSFAPSTTAKFGGGRFDSPFLIAGDELIAGATEEYGSPNRWVEESKQNDELAWSREA